MDVPAQVVKDRTLIPLRVMAESIGKRVEWDADNRLIYIGSVQFYDKANAAKYAAALKDGKEEDQEIIETPVPTEEPTPTPAPNPNPNPATSTPTPVAPVVPATVATPTPKPTATPSTTPSDNGGKGDGNNDGEIGETINDNENTACKR
mgnify:CR=1 FL=1